MGSLSTNLLVDDTAMANKGVSLMRNRIVDQAKNINILNFLVTGWGIVMLPLWVLIFYYSFKEGPLEIQGLVMSSLAIGVSLCFISTPLWKRPAAVIALVFGCVFTGANFIYNIESTNLLISGTVFSTLCLVLPSILLLRLPVLQSRSFGEAISTAPTPQGSYQRLGLLIVCLVVLLGMAVALYGVGFVAW